MVRLVSLRALKGNRLIADQARTPAYTVDLRRYAVTLKY